MLPLQLTTSQGSLDKLFAQPSRSRFSIESRATTAPVFLEVDHNVHKNGQISTAIAINDDARPDGILTGEYSRIRVMVKLMYNPLEGRADVPAVLDTNIADLLAIVQAQLPSLINREV